jgi:hypothetical protein
LDHLKGLNDAGPIEFVDEQSSFESVPIRFLSIIGCLLISPEHAGLAQAHDGEPSLVNVFAGG